MKLNQELKFKVGDAVVILIYKQPCVITKVDNCRAYPYTLNETYRWYCDSELEFLRDIKNE